MRNIIVRNVNVALASALEYIAQVGDHRDSRNGPVISFPYPVLTEYQNPMERVLFSPLRNANPFFHFMESMWMLAGARDVAVPAYFVKRMAEYSDDGKTFWGAYGYRWRRWFGYDQLDAIVNDLRANPTSRRAVLAMWDGREDLDRAAQGGKDVPCNTQAYFDTRDGKLNMTVCCRSNDLLWGAYGANAVHMAFLQEYVADRVGVPVGAYRQFSNDLHLYTRVLPQTEIMPLAIDAATHNAYATNPACVPTRMHAGQRGWDTDLVRFMRQFDEGISPVHEYHTEWFSRVAQPMLLAWQHRKNHARALQWAGGIDAVDWRIACCLWLDRRHAKEDGNG